MKNLDDLNIKYRYIKPENNIFVLFLPGGGINLGGLGRFKDFQERLRVLGVGSLTLDFPGQGETGGSIKESSLRERIDISLNILNSLKEELGNNIELFVYGVSMGGFVANYLLEFGVSGLVLHSTAAFSEKSIDINFGEKFTKEIRKDGSWKNSPTFDFIEKTNIPIMYIYSNKDEVIPKEINNKYLEILNRKDDTKIIELDDAKHGILNNDQENIKFKQRVFDNLLDFIKK